MTDQQAGRETLRAMTAQIEADATPLPTPAQKLANDVKAFDEEVKSLSPDMLTREPDAREWLATFQDPVEGSDDATRYRRKRGLLACGQLHIIAGEGGAGKGRFAVQLGLAVAASPEHGTVASRLNVDVHPSVGKVLILVGEDDAQEIHTRAYGAQQVEGWKPHDIDKITKRVVWRTFRGTPFHLVDADKYGPVTSSQDLVTLRSWLKEKGPWALIIIDPLARFLGIEENDNNAMHAAAAEIEGLCDVNGKPAVLVVAHTRKPDKKNGSDDLSQHDVRGASAVVNAARIVAVMQPRIDTVSITGDGKPTPLTGASGISREISEIGVRLALVKNNLSAKGSSLDLKFATDGGLRVEKPAEEQERRKKQWHGGTPTETTPETTPRNGRAAKGDDDTEARRRREAKGVII